MRPGFDMVHQAGIGRNRLTRTGVIGVSRHRTRTRRGRSSPPFRAWGLVLSAVLILLLTQQLWLASSLVAAALIFYLLAVRQVRCRVETKLHRPCLWRVRGLLGCCEYHVGLKRGLPGLVPVHGFGLPGFMWPRYDFQVTVGAVEPQPSPHACGAAALTPQGQGFALDQIMMWLAVASIAVALASFLRDVLAG